MNEAAKAAGACGGCGACSDTAHVAEVLPEAPSSLFVPFPIQAHCSAFRSFLSICFSNCCRRDVHARPCTHRPSPGACASGYGSHEGVAAVAPRSHTVHTELKGGDAT